jgi:L-2-hydroxyglutarate oxidase LhgO
VACAAAIFSPSTGIFDSHAYVRSLQGDVEAAGGAVALRTPFLGAAAVSGGFEIEAGGKEPMSLRCRVLVNAAGLAAPDVAQTIDGLAQSHTPRPYYAQGAYFRLAAAKSPFSRLIYPIPEPGGLGVHATIDLGGQVRFGPDVMWIDAPDYRITADRSEPFYKAIRHYWPGLPDGALAPAYAGVRPKISGPGEPNADFLIQGPDQHGLDGLVNLFGIESPGLTSSLAIADEVARLLNLDVARARAPSHAGV